MAQSTQNLSVRIESMFGRDRIFAWGFVVALWATVAFVLLSINSLIPSNGIRIASWIAALVLVVFNTASIGAMVRHYSHDKDHIYGTDIKHLDAGR
jgi:tetrahydromethanopterin S-methyltransferase subunit E